MLLDPHDYVLQISGLNLGREYLLKLAIKFIALRVGDILQDLQNKIIQEQKAIST